MNRSNVGNVVTNAMQIESVAATTASRFLGSADSALNNLSKQEKKDYFNMKADKMRDETTKYYNSPNEGEEILDVGSIMQSAYKENSEQISQIKTKQQNDSDFLKFWKESVKNPEPLEELIKDITGGDENADV